MTSPATPVTAAIPSASTTASSAPPSESAPVDAPTPSTDSAPSTPAESASSDSVSTAVDDPEYQAALARLEARRLEEAKLMCSLENKEACVMCSG